MHGPSPVLPHALVAQNQQIHENAMWGYVATSAAETSLLQTFGGTFVRPCQHAFRSGGTSIASVLGNFLEDVKV